MQINSHYLKRHTNTWNWNFIQIKKLAKALIANLRLNLTCLKTHNNFMRLDYTGFCYSWNLKRYTYESLMWDLEPFILD